MSDPAWPDDGGLERPAGGSDQELVRRERALGRASRVTGFLAGLDAAFLVAGVGLARLGWSPYLSPLWQVVCWLALLAIPVLAVVSAGTSVARRALRRSRDERRALHTSPQSPVPAVGHEDPTSRERARLVRAIDSVRERYAAALTDIAYVIEHQGLFDLAHEPARRLTSLLAQVQDLEPETVSTAELRTLAGDLEAAWQHAVQYADRLGYDALHGDRAQARQAANLARKAASGAVSEHEREALLARVKTILDTLDVVIPRPEAGRLGTGLAPALPAPREQPRP